MNPQLSPWDILDWYRHAGVEDVLLDQPVNRYQASAEALQAAQATPRPAAAPPPRPAAAPPAVDLRSVAAHLAGQAGSLDALKAALASFEGCPLKHSAQSTVFADGNPKARVMIIGEAPGADEDRLGVPFIGASGRLLNRMLASVGLDRSSVYITNVLPWRPPGNRKPSPAEVEQLLPFIERHIELVAPEMLLLLGGAAVSAILARNDPISRLRGQWFEYGSAGLSRPVVALPTYHPAFLLRTPGQKKEAWRDFLALRKRLG